MNRKPNILWIVSDHQVHATRPHGRAGFPLQEFMARHGLSFERAYSVLPVCSPARASMLTGLYPHAHGLTENEGRFGGRSGLDPIQWMIHHPFLEAGYRCAWFGKWHVDIHRSANHYGFEGCSLPGYGYPYGMPEYAEYLNRMGLDAPVVRVEIPGESGLDHGQKIRLMEESDWFDFESGSARLRGSVRTHEAHFVADQARQWIESAGDDPWFVRVDPWGPHPPYLVGEPFGALFEDAQVGLPASFHHDLESRPDHHRRYRDYWANTLGINEGEWCLMYRRALQHVSQVESALLELAGAVDLDNTLVIFNSDHGDAVGTSGGVANKGGLMTEATMQIPLYMAGAGLPTNESRDQLVSNMDLPATVMTACGMPGDPALHGRSLWPIISSPDQAWRPGLLTQHYGLHEPIVQRAWYEGEWKLVMQPDGFRELYRLSEDPGEVHNLAGQAGVSNRESQLVTAMFRAMSDIGDDALIACSRDT